MASRIDTSAAAIGSESGSVADDCTMISGVGVGVGVGCAPGLSGSPAETESESTHTSAKANTERRIVESPLVMVVSRGGVAARTQQFTTDDPADLVLFRTLISQEKLAEAAQLCRERMLYAPDGRPAARWTKDRALVHLVSGRPDEALDLLASRYQTALAVGGAFAGRYEASMGQTLRRLNQYDDAFRHLTAARVLAESEGDTKLCANVDVSTGRAYTDARRPDNSYFYFDRAYAVALKSNDFLLQAEIDESRALALEAEQRYAEAEDVAYRSVRLAGLADNRVALAECSETWLRVKGRANR